GIDRYLLVGRPSVVYTGAKALHPYGRSKSKGTGRLLVDTADSLRIDVYGEATAPPPPNAKPRPFAVISGGPRVVMRELDGSEEIYRLTADQVDATIAQDRQIEEARAERGAHIFGLAEDGGQRELFGSRITLARDVLPPGS